MSPILQSIANGSARGYGALLAAAAAATSYDSIATVTVGAGGTSAITFNSIAADWTHLQLRGILFNASDVQLIRLNNVSAGDYSSHGLQGNGSSASAYDQVNNNRLMQTGTALSNSTSPYTFVLDLLDYANTNKYKTARMLHGFDTNGGGQIQLLSGSWRSTSAVTRIDIVPGSGTIAQYSHVALYGIKGA